MTQSRRVSYSLSEDFEFTNNKRVSRGFHAVNQIEIRVDDIARVGEVVDAAVQAGAATVSNIRFDVKERAASERQALKEAVADARARAEAMAAGAGVTLGPIVRIEEGSGGGYPIPRPPPQMAQRMMAAQADTPVSAGDDRDPGARHIDGGDQVSQRALTAAGYRRAERVLSERDPVMGRIIALHGRCGLARAQREDPFIAMVEAIVWQQLSGKAAATIYGRVLDLLPNRALTPAGLLAVPRTTLRAGGTEQRQGGVRLRPRDTGQCRHRPSRVARHTGR